MEDQLCVDILSESLTDELVAVVGLPKTPVFHWLFRKLFCRFTDKLAIIGGPYNRIVREEGLPEASSWLLKKFCRTPQSRGLENIPHEGPLFVISNHPGAYDGLVLFSLLGRQDIKWISSIIPFLDLLPDVRRHILFADRKDPNQKMVVLRNIAAHLKNGKTIVYFGSGHRDPDPAVYTGTEETIENWIPIVEPLFRVVPGLRVMPVIMSGMVSEKWANHRITRLRRKQIDRHRLAEFGQVITQLMEPGKFYITPAISFGKSYTESELMAVNPSGTHQANIIKVATSLCKEHLKEFNRAYS